MGVKTIFAKRLKALREEKKISQDTLAKELGISRGSVSFYENGERTADIEILEKVSNFFGVDYDYLMGVSSARYNKSEAEETLNKMQLSDKAIENIINYSDLSFVINRFIESGYFTTLIDDIVLFVGRKILRKEYEAPFLSIICPEINVPIVEDSDDIPSNRHRSFEKMFELILRYSDNAAYNEYKQFDPGYAAYSAQKNLNLCLERMYDDCKDDIVFGLKNGIIMTHLKEDSKKTIDKLSEIAKTSEGNLIYLKENYEKKMERLRKEKFSDGNNPKEG